MADRSSHSIQYRFRTANTEADEPLTLEQHAKAARSVREAELDVSLTSRQSNMSSNSRSIMRGSKTLKSNTYSRVNKTALVQCMSEKQIQIANENQPLTEKHYSTANLSIPAKGNGDVVGLLREKCSNYEKTIYDLYEKRDEQASELQLAQGEVKRLRELYEGKLEQVSSVSNEITARIEKEQAEKNLFIKEINNKNIEINKLRESYSILKAENETLNVMLKEKQNEIEQLEGRLQEVQLQKDRLEKYELAASSSASTLQEIEDRMLDMDSEMRFKDKTIEELRAKTNTFGERLQSYEDKIAELQSAASSFAGEKSRLRERVSEIEAQSEQWKQSYLAANRELEHLPQVQIKLKNALMTNEDLQLRIQDLLQTQQKLKLQIGSQTTKDRRLNELESALQNLQRAFREKEELLDQTGEELTRVKSQSKHWSAHQQTISALERQLQEKSRECKSLERKFEEKNILSSNLDRELKRLTDENDKFRERNEKWDQIFKENKRLTGLLMDKINEIEQLQHSINSLESRIATLTNEVLKQTALYEQSSEMVAELNSNLQSLQVRLQCQANTKLQLQEKSERLAAEVVSLSKSLGREKETARQFGSERECLRRDIEQLQNRMTEESAKSELLRTNYETQLLHERSRVEQANTEARELRRRYEQLNRREKDQSDTISSLESDKRTMLNQYSTLRANYEQVVSKNSALEKWHAGYLHLLSSVTRTASDMQHTSQQLLA